MFSIYIWKLSIQMENCFWNLLVVVHNLFCSWLFVPSKERFISIHRKTYRDLLILAVECGMLTGKHETFLFIPSATEDVGKSITILSLTKES